MPEHTTFISFGYRCSSAGILKRLGLKHESYPFDWIVSRIPVIQDCIATDFQHYLSPTNYLQITTCVSSYDYMPLVIGNEQVLYNTHYLDASMASHHTSAQLQMHRDTYAYPLAMNHHNIKTCEHHDYFTRCVDRFRAWMATPPPPNARKMFLYIHPALHEHEYTDALVTEFADFQAWLCNHIGWKLEGLVFFPIKTTHPYPITEHIPQFIQRVTDGDSPLHAYKVFTNRDFIDAGEVFYRNPYIEGDEMASIVNLYSKGHRPMCG